MKVKKTMLLCVALAIMFAMTAGPAVVERAMAERTTNGGYGGRQEMG